MADRPGFMMYFDFAPALAKLTDEEAGKLFKAIMDYACTGTVYDLPGICGFAFEVIRPRLDKDQETYEEKCRKNGYTAYVREAKKRNESYLSYDEWVASTTNVNDCEPPCTNVHERHQLNYNSTTTQLNSNTTTTTTTTQKNEEAGAPGVPHPDPVAVVLADYLIRINPTASPTSLDELRSFAEDLGEEVCTRAFDIALDNKKTTWPYIKAILRDKAARGVKCLADWDALETEREQNKGKPASQAPADYGSPEDFYK